MDHAKQRYSFRSLLSISMLVCWLLPIIIISTTAGYLLNRNYNRNLRNAADADIRSAMRQVEIRLDSVLEDSKAVSYDGLVYQAYRSYRNDPENAVQFSGLSEYLSQKFSRNPYYRGVFLVFLDESIEEIPYAAPAQIARRTQLAEYQEQIIPAVSEILAEQKSGIVFTLLDDRLYMVRNLMDADYSPYAMLICDIEKEELLQSVYALSENRQLDFSIDGLQILTADREHITIDPFRIDELTYSASVNGHSLVCDSLIEGLNIWTTFPVLRWTVLFVGSLVFPLLAVIIFLFSRNINRPIATLIEANSRMQEGERGYQITQKAPNSEFALLYRNFNSMSCQLKSQFDQLYEEQQALQQAKIKALQSQINPHFLNNTLEVINWEARMADNERISSMIEALSTMLDAAIGRDGRSQVPLCEELQYAQAYLHITKQRLGDRLTYHQSIDPNALNCTVPLLMLQPILENAVEYDLSRTGGELSLRVQLLEDKLRIAVEHDGIVSEDGWKKIRAGLYPDPAVGIGGRSVGIHNVVNRLALLYGDSASIDIRESSPGRVLAEILLPAPTEAKNKQ